MKLRVTSPAPWPGQWLEVDWQDYIVESVEPDADPMAPRRVMQMGGGPYGEPIAMPTIYIVTLRPITQAEDQERRRLYGEQQVGKSPFRGIGRWGASIRRAISDGL